MKLKGFLPFILLSRMIKSYLLLTFFLSIPAHSGESLGTLSIKEIFLNPEFIVKEQQEAEFRLDESSIRFEWQKSDELRAELQLGSEFLKNTPLFFTDTPKEQVGIVEAYGEWDGRYGRFRMGLVPLNFGYEGRLSESQLHFKRSLLFENRIVGLRDMGLEFFTSHNGYYTKLTIHNGEGGEQADNRMFFSANWGWTNNSNSDWGMAAQTGTTKPEATQTSTSSLAGFQPLKNSKIRMGGIFSHWYPNKWDLVLEAYLGSVLYGDEPANDFFTGHFDLNYSLSSKWSLHGRYDYLDPHKNVKGDALKEVSLGVSLSDVRKNSVLYLMVTKIIEENTPINNDQLRLIWRLTPQI